MKHIMEGGQGRSKPFDPTKKQHFLIGTYVEGNSHYTNYYHTKVDMDRMKFFNRVLTDEEVDALFNE